MRKFLSIIFLAIFSLNAFGQSTIDPMDWYKGVSRDSIKRYKYYTYSGDSAYVDTNLRLDKYIKLNLLRRDNLKMQRFANQGENYNFLSYNYDASLNPQMGFKTKHINYLKIEDIKYYDVATPFTELALKTGYYRGQFLDAFLSTNINPQLNVGIGYKGLRSVGRYRNSLSSHGNLKISLNYKSKSDIYRVRTHFTFQDLLNQESGGIENDDSYIFNEANFSQRTAFAMNLLGASSFIKGKRLYINQGLKIPLDIANISGKFHLQHEGYIEDKYFLYSDGSAANAAKNRYFYGSDVLSSEEFKDSTNFTNIQNDLYLTFSGSEGKSFLKFGAGYNYQNYSFGQLKVINDNKIIPAYIEGTTLSAKAAARLFPFNNFDISVRAEYNIGGKYSDAFVLHGMANLKIGEKNNIGAGITVNSFYPDMQFWLYQSNYTAFNYFNKLDKQYKSELLFYIDSPKWIDASVKLINHKKYTYFESTEKQIELAEGSTSFPANSINPVKTVQLNNDLNLLEIGIHKNFEYGVFGFDTNTIYQEVLSGEEALRIPKIITRNVIYYHDYWFRKALQIQIGVKSKYFSEFNSFMYNPLLGMYFKPLETGINQDGEEVELNYNIGNYPLFDFFINARIRTARIYFEVQNFTQPIMKENHNFSAPHYPGADLTFRLGLVWNFFT